MATVQQAKRIGEGVLEVIHHNMTPMEAIAKSIQRNDEGIDRNLIEQWKKSFIDIAGAIDLLQIEVEVTRAAIDSAEYREKRAKLMSDQGNSASSSASSSNPSEDLKLFLHQKISQDMRRLSTSQGQRTKGIKRIFKMTSDTFVDDDLEVIESDETEDTFKCPYSGSRMREPMKSTACIHHMDKTSVDAQLHNNPRQGTFKCPIPGCTGRWTKDNISLDEEFMARMNRFFRIKGRATATASSQAYDVDENDGYTDV